MEGAFTHLGNHLISDSAATIKAGGDDLSTLDPDEALLYGKRGPRPGRRRDDDDDNQTEFYEDEDADSLTSFPVDGMKNLGVDQPEELPEHACSYVLGPLPCLCPETPADASILVTAGSIPLPLSSSA